jgi:ATP/maltotriose-dependent transcriptional regulator MalT
LTIVQAGTGYGKSTALAALANQDNTMAWYHLTAEDADPVVFLLHLYHAFARLVPGLSEAPLATLEGWELNRAEPLWSEIVDRLINELAEQVDAPLFLVIDDAHLLNRSADALRILDRFIGLAPIDLHVILATRYPLDLPSLVTWRARAIERQRGWQHLRN